jgi:hypothetical protein
MIVKSTTCRGGLKPLRGLSMEFCALRKLRRVIPNNKPSIPPEFCATKLHSQTATRFKGEAQRNTLYSSMLIGAAEQLSVVAGFDTVFGEGALL